jgi:hypothetical protein
VLFCLPAGLRALSVLLQYGVTALHQAVRGNHATCVAVLLRHGANLFALDVQGQSALEEAIEDGQTNCEVVRGVLLPTTSARSLLLTARHPLPDFIPTNMPCSRYFPCFSGPSLVLQALTTHLQGLATAAKTDKAIKVQAKEMLAAAAKQRIAIGKRDKARAKVQAKVGGRGR